MDISYRLIMFLVGLIIIGFMAWDYIKHNSELKSLFEKKLSKFSKSKFKNNDLLSAARNFRKNSRSEIEEIPINFPRYDQDLVQSAMDEVIDETEEIALAIEQDRYEAPEEEIISISLTVVSRQKEGFPGRKLVYALNNAKLHFGKNKIFHRHKLDDGTGDILFSIAKAVEPGFFNIIKLENENVPGITLFMQLDSMVNNEKSFDLLVKTAKQLAFILNGELLDDEKEPLTLQTLSDYKAMVKAYSKQGVMFEV